MEMEKRTNNKFSDLNPICSKDNNFNVVNIYGTNLKHKKSNCNEYKKAIKLKRNFK